VAAIKAIIDVNLLTELKLSIDAWIQREVMPRQHHHAGAIDVPGNEASHPAGGA